MMSDQTKRVTYINFTDKEGLLIEAPRKSVPASAERIDSIEYKIDYRSEKGRLSQYLIVQYKDGTKKDVHLDTVTNAQPELWEAKQRALKSMDDYNANFILGGAFPVVWQIVTMSTSITPVTEVTGAYNRGFPHRVFSKQSAPDMLESTGAVRPGTAT